MVHPCTTRKALLIQSFPRRGFFQGDKSMGGSCSTRRAHVEQLVSDAVRSDPFDDDRRSHAARSAHRNEAGAQAAPLELIENGADQNRTGARDGMA